MATFIRYILVLVEAVCSLMLIGVILIQRTKSQGLGMALGGQMGEALFGARMGNVLTRVTVILGIIFLVNTTLLAYIGASSRRVSVTDDAVVPIPAAPAAPMAAPGGALPVEMPTEAAPVDVDASAPVEIDASGAAAPAEAAPVAEVPETVPVAAP
ncbi:MAG: preprotein translocase subunit SecG [Kiritimatiellae bacterium]|nr:preprotein translocase subunit SecG [Kiritimatiellia bacterium]